MYASGVDEEAMGDEDAIEELKVFLEENGVRSRVYKSDQEPSLKAFIDEALKRAGAASSEDDDAVACAVPEYSAVGESASNGKAERAVQTIEDLARTLKSALEARIGARVGSTHPMMRWIVRHAALILNQFSVILLRAEEDEAQNGSTMATGYMPGCIIFKQRILCRPR